MTLQKYPVKFKYLSESFLFSFIEKYVNKLFFNCRKFCIILFLILELVLPFYFLLLDYLLV